MQQSELNIVEADGQSQEHVRRVLPTISAGFRESSQGSGNAKPRRFDLTSLRSGLGLHPAIEKMQGEEWHVSIPHSNTNLLRRPALGQLAEEQEAKLKQHARRDFRIQVCGHDLNEMSVEKGETRRLVKCLSVREVSSYKEILIRSESNQPRKWRMWAPLAENFFIRERDNHFEEVIVWHTTFLLQYESWKALNKDLVPPSGKTRLHETMV